MKMEKLKIKNEQELFQYLKNKYFPDIKRYNDKFSYTDCYSKNERYEIELKVRRMHYDKMMIEYFKYCMLTERAKKFKRLPVYICSSPEGIFMWMMDIVNINWMDYNDLPVTTDFENNKRVCKRVGFLSVSSSILLWGDPFISGGTFKKSTVEGWM
jgi:hypothetical protein